MLSGDEVGNLMKAGEYEYVPAVLPGAERGKDAAMGECASPGQMPRGVFCYRDESCYGGVGETAQAEGSKRPRAKAMDKSTGKREKKREKRESGRPEGS